MRLSISLASLAFILTACPDTRLGPIPCQTVDNCPKGWDCSAQGQCIEGLALTCSNGVKDTDEADVD